METAAFRAAAPVEYVARLELGSRSDEDHAAQGVVGARERVAVDRACGSRVVVGDRWVPAEQVAYATAQLQLIRNSPGTAQIYVVEVRDHQREIVVLWMKIVRIIKSELVEFEFYARQVAPLHRDRELVVCIGPGKTQIRFEPGFRFAAL